MRLIKKIIAGDELRPTRFHTEGGDFIDWSELPGLALASASWIRRKIKGKFIIKPWWVFGATGFVEKNLSHNDLVLEVGSGYSTLWLAKQCHKVFAIEECDNWRGRVESEANKLKINNIKFTTGESFEIFNKMWSGTNPEVVIIDGPRDRLEIFKKIMNTDKRPRMIIYDDTDKSENRHAFVEIAKEYNTNVFRGFKPQTLHASETTVFILHA